MELFRCNRISGVDCISKSMRAVKREITKSANLDIQDLNMRFEHCFCCTQTTLKYKNQHV